MSYDDTKMLVEVVLSAKTENARTVLHATLAQMNQTEGALYDAIPVHCPAMLSTDEWFKLLSRLPNRVLRSQLDLPGLLSEEQIKALPPVSG